MRTKPAKKVGVNWIDSFLSRHQDLKCKFACSSSRKRALCENPVIINGFFDQLLKLITTAKQVVYEYIYSIGYFIV